MEWRKSNKAKSDKQSKNWHWGVCPEHFDEVFDVVLGIDERMFALERSLGLPGEGWFRSLPDGVTCTIYSLPWKNYLQNLIDNPPS